MRISLIILSIFLIVFHSCNSKSAKDSQRDVQIQLPEREFYDFKIRDHLNQTGELLLSTIANEIRYIPLETTPTCLLSRCRRVEIFNNHIYVADTKALYKFDMDGSFIQQIGKNGNGPGEYGSVLWFNFIDSTNEIVLYSYPTGRINIHDAASGKFKRSFRLDIEPCGVIEFPPGKLSFFTWNTKPSGNQSSRSEIYICNLEGNIIDSIPDERIPHTGNIRGPARYYVRNESLHYMDYFQDTLFSLSENAVKESYASFGLKNKVNATQMELKIQPGDIGFPDYLYISGRVLEKEESLYITVEKGFGFQIQLESFKFFFNKTSGQIVNCTSVINDLDNGMPFWPKSVYKDSVLIDFYPAIEFLEYFQTNFSDSERSDDLNDLINRVNVNDNPIVILACQPMIKEPEL